MAACEPPLPSPFSIFGGLNSNSSSAWFNDNLLLHGLNNHDTKKAPNKMASVQVSKPVQVEGALCDKYKNHTTAVHAYWPCSVHNKNVHVPTVSTPFTHTLSPKRAPAATRPATAWPHTEPKHCYTMNLLIWFFPGVVLDSISRRWITGPRGSCHSIDSPSPVRQHYPESRSD